MSVNANSNKNNKIKDVLDKPSDAKIIIKKKKNKTGFEDRPTLRVIDNNKFRRVGNDPNLKNKAIVTYGKFNPPTIGHTTIAEELNHLSEGEYDAYVFVTSATGGADITFDQKIRLVNEAMGQLLNVVDFPVNNPIQLFQIMEQYYDDLTIVVGPDRYEDFKRIAHTYNGKDFIFERIEVINYKNPDVDRELVSSSALKNLLKENRDEEAKQMLAPNLVYLYEDIKQLFN